MQKKWIALALVTLIACTVTLMWQLSTVEESGANDNALTYADFVDSDIAPLTEEGQLADFEELSPPPDE